MVLVDTDVIAKALAKPLMEEMGDTIATYFEARACRAPCRGNQVAGKPALAVGGLATMCWQCLQKEGKVSPQDFLRVRNIRYITTYSSWGPTWFCHF